MIKLIVIFCFIHLFANSYSAAQSFAFWSKPSISGCGETPSPGDVCPGGAIYLGSLSPGATSGSGTDHYMTTPGGCADISPGDVSGGSGASSYALADFTVTCSGTDNLVKNWHDGGDNYYDIPALQNYTATVGAGNGAANTDVNYGSTNTADIVAITSSAEGGYHAAARYCDKLVYGGYSDWYLANRFEFNLMYINRASIPGLDISANWYWTSTEYANFWSWIQRFSDGTQGYNAKNIAYKVRCVRRF